MLYRSLLALVLSAMVTTLAHGQQNVTVVAVDPPDRLAGSTVLGEWATAGNTDNWSGTNVTGLAAAGGYLTGDDNSAALDASVSRTVIAGGPDLDLGFNDYLQLRLKLPAAYAGDVKIEYGTTLNTGFGTARVFVLPAASILKDGAFHTYRLDLGLEVFWRDFLRDLRVTPLVAATGHFEIDYLEVGDVAGTGPALNLDTNFIAGLTAANTSRMESKHVCVWWNPADTTFTTVHARRALRMCEESYQVYCKKLGYNEPFREFNSTTTPQYKINFITWYDGFWAGGYANRGHMNVGSGGLGDEGWGNPVPHEFGHVVQMAQQGQLDGGHWESHANYLRAGRNLHFYTAIPGCIPAIDNLTGNSNYRPDHNRHIYADQRYYLSLDDYGTQFGLPTNYAAIMWRDGASGLTLVEKLAGALPSGTSVKDVACECMKHWPMLDFVEKTRIRAQHWGNTADRAAHFWNQGAQLIAQQDKPGWWRVPLERAPDRWAYQMHDLTATAGATITAEIRGLDMPGTTEDWRWCFAAISAGDVVRYSPVWAPGTQSFTLTSGETQVFLIVTATPNSTPLDLGSLSNTKPVDKNADRLRYAYEVRLVNVAPAIHQYSVANPSGYHAHSNGGGVVGPSATVASTAYVGPTAKVVGSAQVLGTARVEDYAVIQGSAIVQASAVVSGSALVEGNALVEGAARVRDRAHVTDGAAVRGRALISGYTQLSGTTVTDDAVVRGCASPFGGTISGTAIMDHDYSMDWTVSSGVQFSHIPWGGWWDAFYAQTLRAPRGLRASYRTQETDGEQWWDEFGALHAQLRGSPLRAVDAAMGSAVMVFDGSSNYAALDRSVADTPLFSFSGWIKPGNAIGTTEPVLFLGSSATKAMKLQRNTAGQAVFTISDGTTTRALTSTSVLPANEWRNIAVTLDGSTGKLYIGGVSEASTPITLTPLTVLAANNGTALQANYIGRDWAGTLFKGSLEDMRFYNVAMTAAEVLAESARHGNLIGQFSPIAATDFNGTTTTAESGVRNGRVRTLSAWVKPRSSDAVSNYEAVFDSNDELGNRQGGGLGLNAGKWVARLDNVGNWATNVTATLGKWQHVALAFDGATATFFINGVQAATRSYPGPSDDSAAAGKCYRIGYSQTSSDILTRQLFDGLVLNARIYDRTLTASQLVLDSDGDGVNDNVEVDLGSNPLDAQSLPPMQSVAGKASTTTGTAIAGVTVFFSDAPNAASTGVLTATTDSNGNYSKGLTAGTWYVAAGSVDYFASADQTVVISGANVSNINFTLTVIPSNTITASAAANGSISPSGAVAVKYAASQTFAFTPNAGYQVASVTVDGASQGAISSYTFTNVIANHTISVTYAVLTPVASYLFENNVTDTTGAYSGTATGSPTYVTGKVGSYAIQFNGTSQYVRINRPVSNNWSIAFWVKTTQTSPTGTAWYQGNGLVDGEVGGITNDFGVSFLNNKLAFGVGNPDTTLQSASSINSGNWVHVACTRDSVSGQMKVYVNGTLETTGSGPTGTRNTPTTLHIGKINAGGNYYSGAIDQLKIYQAVISAADIAALASEGSTNYTITASAAAGGTISPAGSIAVGQGNSQAFTITPNSGYAISLVTVDSVSQGAVTSYTFSNVQAAHTITATFAAIPTYTITASAGSNGIISPTGAVSVNQGSGQTFTFAADAGYVVDQVTIDGGAPVAAGASYAFTNAQAAHTISVTFKAVPTYTITASAGTNGSISPTGAVSVTQGNSQTFTITPNSGYQVAAVTVDGVSQGSVTSYSFSNVQAAHAISAAFSAIPTYTITASAGTNGSISPTGAVSVTHGNSQTFAITSNSGYQVSAVTVDGTNMGAVTTYTFSNVQAAHTISATFAIYSGLALPIDTVAYYSFDASANLGKDASANANNLVTATGTPTYDGSGRFGGALSLPGSSTLGINAGKTAIPATLNSGANPFSVSVWIKPTSAVISGWISWGAYANMALRILPTTSDVGGNTQLERWGANYAVNSGKNLRDGAWHNVVYTYDYANSRTETFYVDGVKVGTARTNTWTPGTTAGNFTVGQNYTTDSPMIGLLDDLLIVNHALSQAEITALQAGISVPAATNTLTASAGTGGTISPSGAVVVNSGANQAITITPNTGYAIASVLVDGTNDAAAVSSGTYTFSNVTVAHSIAATFQPLFASWIGRFPGAGTATGFNDDPDGDGIKNGVEYYFGTHPAQASAGLTNITATATGFTFRHPLNNTATPDVTAIYQWSADLVNWFASGQANAQGVTASLAAAEVPNTRTTDNHLVEVTGTVTGGPPAGVFVRIRVGTP